IGFRPQEYRIEVDDDGTETVVHTKVRALEFSLVPFPAYSAAAITDVRHQTTPSTTTPTGDTAMGDTTATLTRADLDPIETELQDITRKLAGIDARTAAAAGPAGPMFRSIGDYLKQVATGDERALEF